MTSGKVGGALRSRMDFWQPRLRASSSPVGGGGACVYGGGPLASACVRATGARRAHGGGAVRQRTPPPLSPPPPPPTSPRHPPTQGHRGHAPHQIREGGVLDKVAQQLAVGGANQLHAALGCGAGAWEGVCVSGGWVDVWVGEQGGRRQRKCTAAPTTPSRERARSRTDSAAGQRLGLGANLIHDHHLGHMIFHRLNLDEIG